MKDYPTCSRENVATFDDTIFASFHRAIPGRGDTPTRALQPGSTVA